MEKANVRIPLGMSLLLNEIINKLLYEVVEVDGKQEVRNRSLPFRLLYRLNRNSAALAKDAQQFAELKQQCLIRYGQLSEDLSQVNFTEEGQKAYTAAMQDILEIPVEHSIVVLDVEDIDKITDHIIINPESMRLFIAYMTDDEEYLADLNNPITVKAPESVVIGDITMNGEILVKKPAEDVKEEVIEAPVVEEAPKPKKTSTKKASTIKTSTAKKTATTTKKTTTKKTTKKVAEA